MENTRRRGTRNDDGIDRISNLPDPILSHILSFLSTKESVHTSILSKKWKHVWASVPVLSFDLQDFGGYIDLSVSDEFEDPQDGFERFLHGVLENREKSCSLDTFQYEWRYYNVEDEYDVYSLEWLHPIALLMPRVISIYIASHPFGELPDSVFSCASLENFKLDFQHGEILHLGPKSINLPALRTLHLGGVALNDKITRMLFKGCPALEELVLEFCDLDMCKISSRALKKLVIARCIEFVPKKIKIVCSALISLGIDHASYLKRISLKTMASLLNAEIRSYNGDLKLLRKLSNVTTLSLELHDYFQGKELSGEDFLNFQTFYNLKSLKIQKWCMINVFRLISCFLKHSPNLQQLTLQFFQPIAREKLIKEESSDVLFQREYLEMVKILMPRTTNQGSVDRLLSILRACVKTIGKISICHV